MTSMLQDLIRTKIRNFYTNWARNGCSAIKVYDLAWLEHNAATVVQVVSAALEQEDVKEALQDRGHVSMEDVCKATAKVFSSQRDAY